MTKSLQILSLSGGGYMGLYTAHVLAELEDRSQRPLRERFDLVAGTSIGGILGLLIAHGVPMRDVAAAFEDSGTMIFSDRHPPAHIGGVARDMLRFFNRSKYDGEALKDTILRFIPHDLRLADLGTRFIAPAVNLTKSVPTTFRTPHLRNHTNSGSFRAVDVAMATSAAPTIFPIVRIGDDYFCDGGLYANSPDQIALHEAESLMCHRARNITMLSIGATTADYEFTDPPSPSFGLRQWVDEQLIIRMTLAAQQQSTHRILQQRLGERYVRIDAVQAAEDAPHVGLDVATPQARRILLGLARETAASLDNTPGLRKILSHNPGSARFYTCSETGQPEPDPLFHKSRDYLSRLIRRKRKCRDTQAETEKLEPGMNPGN